MLRVLAHHVEFEGRDYPLSVAEISDDRMECTVTPFSGETAATRFVNGTVRIEKNPQGRYQLKKLG